MDTPDAISTRIKICGIREAADALTAADAGADFIGLGFVPGARRTLDQDRASTIVSALAEEAESRPKVVGLFADQPMAEVVRVVGSCGLDMVQLCGVETLDYCDRLGVPVIKVLHVRDSTSVGNAVASLSVEMEALVERGHLVTLDRKVEGLQGGTGQSFDWEIAKRLSERNLPFLLAGGLTPNNVGRAVSLVHPWGVDVSSGVETAGVKDQRKIKEFIQAVRPAGTS